MIVDVKSVLLCIIDYESIAMQMSEEEQRNCIDHYKFTPEELGYWEPYKSVGVPGGAGSLFLWDSRAVHAVSSSRCLILNKSEFEQYFHWGPRFPQ